MDAPGNGAEKAPSYPLWGIIPGGRSLLVDRRMPNGAYFVSCSADGAYNAKTRKWSGWPSVLSVCEVVLPKPRHAPFGRLHVFDETAKAKCLLTRSRIVHPGEVNRIRCEAAHLSRPRRC